MIPEPLISWREDALTFMSLFAPWEYNLERLTFVGKRVDGLFSDSHWALAPWIEMNPSLNAYAPSMIEREYFQIRNQDLPTQPIQIAIAGTIQPRKRQKEAVLAVLHLINKGYNIVLNIYGYQLDSFRSYIQEIEEVVAQSKWGGKIKFWGFIEDPHQIARDNHIILCTSTDESASQSILFNQAAGLLPVSCPAGGLPEIVIDGKTGFLADGFEPQHIANTIQRALDSKETWETLIANGRSILLHQCSEPEFMHRILRVMIAAAEIRTSRGALLFREVNTARQFHFTTRVWLLLKTIVRKNRSWLLPANSPQERIARYIYFRILESLFLKKPAKSS
jgi:glycosyltransferase involved in cell wall biosynthesis